MADRTSASIKIGGSLSRALIPALIAAIEADGGRADWDGEPIEEVMIVDGEVLEVCACEISNGIFDAVERFCEDHHLPFLRSSGSCAGAFGPERVIFDGSTPPRDFICAEWDEVLLTRHEVQQLGSFEAIEAWFVSADYQVPPITIVADGHDVIGGVQTVP